MKGTTRSSSAWRIRTGAATCAICSSLRKSIPEDARGWRKSQSNFGILRNIWKCRHSWWETNIYNLISWVEYILILLSLSMKSIFTRNHKMAVGLIDKTSSTKRREIIQDKDIYFHWLRHTSCISYPHKILCMSKHCHSNQDLFLFPPLLLLPSMIYSSFPHKCFSVQMTNLINHISFYINYFFWKYKTYWREGMKFYFIFNVIERWLQHQSSWTVSFKTQVPNSMGRYPMEKNKQKKCCLPAYRQKDPSTLQKNRDCCLKHQVK